MADPPTVNPERVAGLAVARRLAQGTAHTLNNVFTSIIGEASLLEESAKHDARVVESCRAIMAATQRCARLTRALMLHGQKLGSAPDVDVAGLLREVVPVLRETLGRQHQLEARLADDLPVVAGERTRLELLVFLLVQHAARLADGCSRILLSAEPSPQGVALSVAVTSDSLGDDATAAFEAARAEDPVTGAEIAALGRLAESFGTRLQATRPAPDRFELALGLAAAD